MEVDIKMNNPQNDTIIIFDIRVSICFGCVKETSQGDVSFTQPKHMFYRQL